MKLSVQPARGARWALGAWCVALAGCGLTPPSPPSPPSSSSADSASGTPPLAKPARDSNASAAVSAFEQRERDKALAATRQRRLADAALGWEILSVLRPDNADYRARHAQALGQIDREIAERLPRAARAAQRGDWDAATQLYLGVLALQPVNEAAADALRTLERERIKRQQLGKSARQALALARRAAASAAAPVSAAAAAAGATEPAPTLAGSNALEHAALLAGDDEFEAAIALLERQLALDRNDAALQRLLADLQQRRAEALVRQLRARAAAVPTKPAMPAVPLKPASAATAAPAPARGELKSPR